MKYAVASTIDGAGRIVVPKRIRERLGLAAGAPVTIAEHDGVIEIRPSPVEVDLVRRGSVTVIEPRTPVTQIDTDDVRAALERIRGE